MENPGDKIINSDSNGCPCDVDNQNSMDPLDVDFLVRKLEEINISEDTNPDDDVDKKYGKRARGDSSDGSASHFAFDTEEFFDAANGNEEETDAKEKEYEDYDLAMSLNFERINKCQRYINDRADVTTSLAFKDISENFENLRQTSYRYDRNRSQPWEFNDSELKPPMNYFSATVHKEDFKNTPTMSARSAPAVLIMSPQFEPPSSSSVLQCNYGLLGLAADIQESEYDPDIGDFIFGYPVEALNIDLPERNMFGTFFEDDDEPYSSSEGSGDSQRSSSSEDKTSDEESSSDSASNTSNELAPLVSDLKLFTIFYQNSDDNLQIRAITELIERGWFLYVPVKVWMRKIDTPENYKVDGNIEEGMYECFNALHCRSLIIYKKIELDAIKKSASDFL